MFPLSRLNGASPARAAICLRLSIPSSGNCASRVIESTLPTPGTERSNSSRSRHNGVSRINSPRFIVETGKALFQPSDVVINAMVQDFWGSGPAILLRRQHLDQLSPPGNQCFERLGLFVG